MPHEKKLHTLLCLQIFVMLQAQQPSSHATNRVANARYAQACSGAAVVTTANISDMQAEINLIWKYLLPAMK